MSKRELEGDTDETGTEQPAVVNEDSDPAAKRPALEQPPPQDFSNFKIFVGGVDRGVDTAQFTAHFAQYGTVVDSVVMKVRNRQACLLPCLSNCTTPPSYFLSSFTCQALISSRHTTTCISFFLCSACLLSYLLPHLKHAPKRAHTNNILGPHDGHATRFRVRHHGQPGVV